MFNPQVIIAYVLIVATIAFAFACVMLRRKGKSFEGMICKFMASFGFLSIAVFGNYYNEPNVSFFSFIVVALMFSFFGDVLLGIKEIAPSFKKKLIPLGMGYFLIAHIFALLAFSMIAGFRWYLPVIGVAGGLVIRILCNIVPVKADGTFKIIMSVYYSFLVWKLATAIRMLILAQTTANIVIFVAALFFIISDTCLGIVYFTPVKKKNLWVTIELSTYYPAQILLAMAVLCI